MPLNIIQDAKIAVKTFREIFLFEKAYEHGNNHSSVFVEGWLNFNRIPTMDLEDRCKLVLSTESGPEALVGYRAHPSGMAYR